MATLPPKPEPGEISPTPPAEDRRSVARPTPMAPPGQYQRSDRSSRNNVYIPPSSRPHGRGPPHGDSYVSSGSLRQDDYRRDYADWDRRYGDDYRAQPYRDRREDRRPYDSGRSRDEHDRSRDRDIDRYFDRRRPRWREYDDRDRRQCRTPPRRAGSSDYVRHRSPTSSRCRPPSTRSRGDSPSISLVPSPSSKVKLGSHSLTSPTSSRRPPMTPRRRSHSRSRSRSRSRSLTPPPRRQSYSRSPRRRLSPISKTERYPSPGIPITSPSRPRKTSRHQTPKRSTSRSRSPEPPSPVKHEVAEDVVVLSGDRSTVAMSRIRDDHSLPPPLASASEADPDVKTTNPISNIPTGPRNAGGLPREPPRGPRGYAQQPHSPTGPASRPPPTQSRNVVAPSAASGSTPARTEVAPSPKVESETILPVIPPYTIKTTLKPEIESEITRLRAQRTNLISEYANISKATRRALHELEMASFDLRTAENRRKLADMHLEKARMGVLGIDYVPDVI